MERRGSQHINYFEIISGHESENTPIAIMLVIIGTDENGTPKSVLVGKRADDKEFYPGAIALPTETIQTPASPLTLLEHLPGEIKRALFEELDISIYANRIRSHGVIKDQLGPSLFVVSLRDESAEIEKITTLQVDHGEKPLTDEWWGEFSSPPKLLKIADLDKETGLTSSSRTAVKLALEQIGKERLLGEKFPGLKDINPGSPYFNFLFLLAQNLAEENDKSIGKLKAVLATKIIEGFLYEADDMFNYPPKIYGSGDYELDDEELLEIFPDLPDREINDAAGEIHHQLWKMAFVTHFKDIIRGSISGREVPVTDPVYTPPSILKIQNREMALEFINQNSWQNAYSLLQVITGSASEHIKRMVTDKKTDKILANTANILANLLAGGEIGYWSTAMDTAYDVNDEHDPHSICTRALFILKDLTGINLTSQDLKLMSEQIREVFCLYQK